MSNKYIELYNKALRLAITSHANQVDQTGILYITHPIRVADACDGWVDKIVALLHDVVEDTDCTFDILRAIFPEEIIMAVDAITRRDGESEHDYYVRVLHNIIATRVKKHDLEDNIRLPRFINSLKQKDLDRAAKYHKRLRMIDSVLYNVGDE